MTPVPVTLISAAAMVLLNFWLGWRIAAFREEYKVSVGDGGNEPLLRRMRAQSNFIENAPFVLILVGALELSGVNRWGLGGIAALFVIARVCHGIGMEGGQRQRLRMYGMMGTMLTNLALVIWAVVCAAGICLGR
jgi:uncharacterized membrane protein YecN with MAPEG domain